MVWIDGKERVLHAIKENLCLKIDAMMNGNKDTGANVPLWSTSYKKFPEGTFTGYHHI